MENISYTIITPLGEEHYPDVPVKKALTDIRDVIKTQSKWVYIGRDQDTAETLTEEKLLKAMEDKMPIVLNDMLGGG